MKVVTYLIQHQKLILKAFATVVLILGTVLLQSRVYFEAGVPFTHDGENHLARFANYAVALREGQFPPRWAPNLLNNYGYPVFNYNYPLANLVSVPFSMLDVSYQLSFKIQAVITLSLGAAGVWTWLQLLQVTSWGKRIAVLAYVMSPYWSSLVWFRGTIGEMWALGLLPWVLVSIEVSRSSYHSYWSWWAQLWYLPAAVLGLTAFGLSHNVTVVFGGILISIYASLRFKSIAQWRHWLSALVPAIGLSVWFWIPALLEMPLVNLGKTNLSTQAGLHVVTVDQLLWSPLRFGFSRLGSVDDLGFSLGLLLIFCLVVAAIKYLLGSFQPPAVTKKWLLPVLVVSLLAVFFQLPIFASLWSLPGLSFVQFPWRLSLVATVFGAALVGWVWDKHRTTIRLLMISLLLAQIFTVTQLSPVDRFSKSNLEYQVFSQTTSTSNENLPIDFTFTDIGNWRPEPQIATGFGEVQVESWTGSSRSYRLALHTTALVIEPTAYFPGWQTIVVPAREQPQTVSYQVGKQTQGRIAFSLPAGEYEVTTRFTQWTWPRIISNSISVLTAVGLLGWFLFQLQSNYTLNQSSQQ